MSHGHSNDPFTLAILFPLLFLKQAFNFARIPLATFPPPSMFCLLLSYLTSWSSLKGHSSSSSQSNCPEPHLPTGTFPTSELLEFFIVSIAKETSDYFHTYFIFQLLG